jgi:hypothetical protein
MMRVRVRDAIGATRLRLAPARKVKIMGRFLVRDDGSCGCGADPCRCGQRNARFWAGENNREPAKPGAKDAAAFDWTATPQAQQTGLRALNQYFKSYWSARQ